MGTKRGNTTPPEATAPKPVEASPMQNLLDTRYSNILTGLSSGKDVKDIKELAPELNLYNSSIANNQDYAGEGLLSPNALSGGNANQLGLISKQIKDRRQQQASGDLYNSVQNAQHEAETGGQWSAQMADRRNLSNAEMQNQRYTAYLNRPKKTPFWQQVLKGAMGGASALGV